MPLALRVASANAGHAGKFARHQRHRQHGAGYRHQQQRGKVALVMIALSSRMLAKMIMINALV